MMTSPYIWLQLGLSPAECFEGPCLREHFPPYKCLDDLSNIQPMIILAIGDRAKRHRLASCLSVDYLPEEDGAITLRPLGRHGQVLLVDCELHRSTLTTLGECPAGSCRQHMAQNVPGDLPSQTMQFSCKLYWQLLSQFSSAILLFLEDFDPVQVIEMLAIWVCSPSGTPGIRPRLVLVHGAHSSADAREFDRRLSSKVLEELRLADATGSYTSDEVEAICQGAFGIFHISTGAGDDAFAETALFHSEEGFSERQAAALNFSAVHTKSLLVGAIVSFVQQGGPFNFYAASRLKNPVPRRLEEYLENFVCSTMPLNIDHSTVVASALVLDAYPPGMHHFVPESAFEHFYQSAVEHVEKSVGLSHLTVKTKESFSKMARENILRRRRSSAAHLETMRIFAATWKRCRSCLFCPFCLARSPNYPLDCGHSFCRACLVICGASAADEWRLTIRRCPLCDDLNRKSFVLRPPTAGRRILSLRCRGRHKAAMMQFLKDLRSHIGLTMMHLGDHFDVFVGSGVGVFFAIALPLGWTLAQCEGRLNQVYEPKPKKSGSLIKFSKGLKWSLQEIKAAGTESVLYVQDKMWFNGLTASSDGPDSDPAAIFGKSDVLVEYQQGSYNTDFLVALAGRLFCHLFYIELVSLPTFYGRPQKCQVQLRCRLPPGPPLMDLLKQLDRRGAQLHFRGDEPQYEQSTLCTEDVLKRCREGEAFSKIMEVEVLSAESVLDVRIGRLLARPENISNCPYTLGRLIRDQGLDSVFGSEDHRFRPGTQTTDGTRWNQSVLEDEIRALWATLRRIVRQTQHR